LAVFVNPDRCPRKEKSTEFQRRLKDFEDEIVEEEKRDRKFGRAREGYAQWNSDGDDN